MNTTSESTPPRWLRVVAILALIWNVLGVLAFAAQLAMDTSELPALQRDFYATMPGWVTLAFGVAVFGGTAGCVALLLRRSIAMALFALSLAGLVVQVAHNFLIADGFSVFGPTAAVLPAITCGVSIGLLLLAARARTRGWLG
ncbi:MAG: hypothetical protein RIT81_25970 [Deltaproteobacteria bacterium]